MCDGESHSIVQLTAGFGLTRQSITKHLPVLEKAGLVERARVGRESRFLYVPEPVNAARTYLDQVAAQWDDALSRLETLVETD